MVSTSQQALVEGEQRLIDFKDIVVLMGDEILHDDVKLAGMGKGKARLLKQFLSLLQRQLQGDGKGHCGGFGGLIVNI